MRVLDRIFLLVAMTLPVVGALGAGFSCGGGDTGAAGGHSDPGRRRRRRHHRDSTVEEMGRAARPARAGGARAPSSDPRA